jgi:NAD(P)H-dependent flavin oxidoreductase YrpB (nitropropane dioxygenase family)
MRTCLENFYGSEWEQQTDRQAGAWNTDVPKAWRDIWSAGHGVAMIDDVPTAAELVERLGAEYRAALALPGNAALRCA